MATSIISIHRKGIEVTEEVGCPGYTVVNPVGLQGPKLCVAFFHGETVSGLSEFS